MLGDIINIETLKEEIEKQQQLCRRDDTSGGINPYRDVIVNNAGKTDTILISSELGSIFS